MAKNKKIIVEVDGDSTGLQKSLNKAEASISGFGKKAGGNIQGFTDKLSGGINIASGGFAELAGAATIAATAFGGLVLKLNDNVRELNQLAKQSGMTVTEIQKLDAVFRSTGLGAEKLLDINQDIKEKMGEGFNTGGGEFASALKEANIPLEQFNKFLNAPDGGIQSLLVLMEEMDRLNLTASQQTRIFEAVGSDSSRLKVAYDELGGRVGVLNELQKTNTIVTEETAAAFSIFDKNMTEFSSTGQRFLYDFITPTIEEMNKLYEVFNKDWTGADFNNFLKRTNDSFWFGGQGKSADFMKNAFGKNSLDSAFYENSKENLFIKSSQAGYEANKDKFTPKKKETKPILSGGWKDNNAVNAAAAKAKAAQDKAAKERLDAEKKLEVAMTEVAESAGDQRLQIFDRQQKELLKTIESTAKIVGKSTEEINAMLDKAKAAGERNRTELINSMIGYSDPNQDLKDANSYAALGLNDTQKSFMADEQDQRINGERNPFTTDNTAKLQEENQRRLELELQLNEQLLGGTEEFEKRKAEIQQRYARESMLIAQQNTQAQMSVLAQGAGDMGTMMEGVFDESSRAASAFFAVQKGINMAKIMMNMQVALSEALSMPFPSNIPAMGKVLTMGAQIVNTAKGINVQGQAHSGIEEVPGSLGKDSTWILQAGERVVSRGQNKQLQEYLDNNTGNGGNNSGTNEIYAPLIVQGNVDGTDDKKFNEMLKKHYQNVNQAVKEAQKRST